jgi:hypothetical protein
MALTGMALTGMALTGMALTGMALTGMALTGMALTGMARLSESPLGGAVWVAPARFACQNPMECCSCEIAFVCIKRVQLPQFSRAPLSADKSRIKKTCYSESTETATQSTQSLVINSMYIPSLSCS